MSRFFIKDFADLPQGFADQGITDLNRDEGSKNIEKWNLIPQSVIEAFGDQGDFARQQLITPALLALLGDVDGRTVLDAGCGNGYLCRHLSQLGAKVIGLEPATSLIHYAIKRETEEPLGIVYIQDDLTTWHSEFRFDVVIINMVLMDIPDYEAALDSCFLHLRQGGKLLLSLTHPCFEASDSEYRENGFIAVREYFRHYRIEQQWGDRFHRPLSHYFKALLDRGGIVEAVIEPQLNESQAQHPMKIERNLHIPAFIVIQVKKSF